MQVFKVVHMWYATSNKTEYKLPGKLMTGSRQYFTHGYCSPLFVTQGSLTLDFAIDFYIITLFYFFLI